MNIFKVFLTIFFLLGFGYTSLAQVSEKKLKDKATLYFKHEKYYEALQLYQQYDKMKQDDEDVKLRLGICHYFNNDMSKAIDYLSSLVYNQKNPSPVAYFYLGCAYHANSEFKKAISNYKSFLKNTSRKNLNRSSVKDEILRCANALKIEYQPELAVVENLGDKVNSRFDEFAPVQSPNVDGKLYFSSSRKGNLGGLRNKKGSLDDLSGKYGSDIFSMVLRNGAWTEPKRMSNLINSPQNDVVLDFNENGSAMLLFKGFDFYSGQILIDSFLPAEEKPLYPPKFNSPVVAERGDGAPFFFNDTTIIFASRITGGYGGSDLYITKFTNGEWSTPQNLGSTINTAYDETTPFLASDGRTLYFSSNHFKGAGGFDIYKAIFNDFKKEWNAPQNMGFPINSPRDDSFFRLNRDGSKGYFSSARVEGYGRRDLYVAYFKTQNMEQLISSTPASFYEVTVGQDEAIANTDYGDNDDLLSFRGELMDFEVKPLFYESDEAVLSPANLVQLNKIIEIMKEYPQLKIELTGNSDNRDQQQFALYFSIKRTEEVAEYLEESGIDASNIVLKGCGSNFPIAKNEFGGVENPLGQRMNRRIDVKFFNSRGIPIQFVDQSPEVEKGLVASKGKFYKKATKGLSYKVQVAKIKQNYNSNLIVDFPDAIVERVMDAPFYYYTIGLYQTFESAEYLQSELERKGITDSTVIPYINGIRLGTEEAKKQSDTYPDLLNFVDSHSEN